MPKFAVVVTRTYVLRNVPARDHGDAVLKASKTLGLGRMAAAIRRAGGEIRGFYAMTYKVVRGGKLRRHKTWKFGGTGP